MPTNVEIKARLPHLGPIRVLVEELAYGPAEILDQVDTFFPAPGGRLKLRTFGDRRGELILYRRADAPGPRPSDYLIAPAVDPVALGAILAKAFGVIGVVKKRRRLYEVGQTRVHLDLVEGLGAFVELEVVLRADQPMAEGVAIARDLMGRLQIADDQLVDEAYLDLLDGQS